MFDTNFHKISGAQILADFIKNNPQKAALAVQSVSLSEAVFWLSSLPLPELSLAINAMDTQKAAVILRRMPLKQSARVFLNLNPATAASILERIPPFHKKRLESELTPQEVKTLKEALKYPKESVARLMQTNFLLFKTETKIEDILLKIKNLPKNKIPEQVYISDKQGILVGLIKTSILSTVPPQSSCGSVMERGPKTLTVTSTCQEAIALLQENALTRLPIINKNGVMVGEVNFWAIAKKPTLEKKNKIIYYFLIAIILFLIYFLF